MGRTGRIAMTKGSDVLRPPTTAENSAKPAKTKEKVSDPSHAKAS
jgi:hypothetical protein